ncbi:PREDICTED: endogenous retrovirus group K member 8 Pol protein-like [Pseudopodoces humilis]|uniref:endogenous retrovirus group K member 8 Pol protein-like n=1 Tax=Pseudopodoces humilis TaxID=181119 RepID=UPI0006B79F33|nr:PREDICTED: endogenous retrovirus group K member 8 Pol protein-like [Pseudopodoces humilis]
MCQLFVHWALTPVRAKLSQTIIYHYMDDILFCQRDPFQDGDLTFITAQLAAKGLVVAPEKFQRQAPWRYLGWILTSSSVHPQKLELITKIHTLNDAQRLVGDLQWVRSIAGIRNDKIAPLMSLLKGTDLQAPITLSADQKSCLIYLGKKLLSTLADRRLPDVPSGLLICNHSVAPCAIIFQWPAWQKEKGGEGPSKSRRGAKQPAKKIQLVQSAKKCAEPLAILERIFTPYTPPMSIWQRTEAIAYLIKKARTRIVEISGAELEHISLPITIENLEWMLRHSEPIQLVLLSYPGTVHNRQPSDPCLQIILKQRWLQQPKVVKQPVKGLTVYTDAGSRRKKTACTWQEDSSWRSKIIDGDAHDSLQTLELTAVAWALSHWRDSKLNIVSDSLYVVGVVQCIEDVLIKPPDNKRLCQLFFQIKRAIEDRNEPCCIIHIRCHQTELGLRKGNAKADTLVSPVVAAPRDSFAAARESRALFHQAAKALQRQFNISLTDAQGIVKSCPQCSQYGTTLGLGINPRGLQACEIWQTDITHVPEFGHLKYVHVTIDTFSKMVWATAQVGEKSIHVIRHLVACFAVMGVPKEIKTDNGPAYVGTRVSQFLQKWGVKHVNGIPHVSSGQAIVERAHRTLKEYLNKQKTPEQLDPTIRLQQVLFTLNFLSLVGDLEQPSVVIHNSQVKMQATPEVKLYYKNPKTGIWEGPSPLLFNGRGYSCVSTNTGPLWVPGRWTKPATKDLRNNQNVYALSQSLISCQLTSREQQMFQD